MSKGFIKKLQIEFNEEDLKDMPDFCGVNNLNSIVCYEIKTKRDNELVQVEFARLSRKIKNENNIIITNNINNYDCIIYYNNTDGKEYTLEEFKNKFSKNDKYNLQNKIVVTHIV